MGANYSYKIHLEKHLESILLYPNPTNGILNIVSPNQPITNVRVFDTSGRIVRSKVFNNEERLQVDISTVNAALYFIEINTEIGSVTKLFVKNSL